jgi:hypothetical protein
VCRRRVGLASLALGFVFQAVGYAGLLAGWAVHTGTARMLTGLALAAAAAVLVIIFEWAVRGRWRDQLLIKVARFDPETDCARVFGATAEEIR